MKWMETDCDQDYNMYLTAVVRENLEDNEAKLRKAQQWLVL